MPFVGSGTIQLAESVSGGPSTILSVNPLGADGTRKYINSDYLSTAELKITTGHWTMSSQIFKLTNQMAKWLTNHFSKNRLQYFWQLHTLCTSSRDCKSHYV